jgi:hypothetical protein
VTVGNFFLMPGQVWCNQAAITASLRSWGTRGGICGVIPRHRSHRFRYRGLNVIPKRSSITVATRGAVHRSVMKPKSHGLQRLIHRSTSRDWYPVSLAGRPDPRWRASAASPRRPRPCQRESHRQTDRSLISKRVAISAGCSPSSTMDTAKRRNCSAVEAFLGSNMFTIVAHASIY